MFRRLVVLLVAFLAFWLPATVLAQQPPAGQVCTSCHATETRAWENSRHARAGVACEACHGPYAAEHPRKKGVMKIEIESPGCRDCHFATYEQWKSSPHAKTGVQCIACHLSHSQQFRLTDGALCVSCHRHVLQESSHAAHENAGLTCVECHASSVSTDATELTPPSHTFTVVAVNCLSCHEQSIRDFVAQAKSGLQGVSSAQPLTIKARNNLQNMSAAQTLASRLEACEDTNRWLLPMTVVNLGLGLGVGGLLGVIFMLVFGHIAQRRARR